MSAEHFPPPEKVTVIGAGSWGTTVASLVSHNAPVVIWARRPELADHINQEHENPDYLAGFTLPDTLSATSDLEEALHGTQVVAMAVPSHGYRAVLEDAGDLISPNVPVVSLSKGLELETLLRMTEVTLQVLSNHHPDSVGVLSGPNLAVEVMQSQPAAAMIAMSGYDWAQHLQPLFSTHFFRVYTNPDPVGAEIAGAVKNVMAIAAGGATGLGLGMNSLAGLITRALAEMARLGLAAGGRALTFGGLAGVGDLIATCSSHHSRNHQVGLRLAQGQSLDQITAEMKMVAEGVKTTAAVLKLAERLGVEMPIAQAVGKVLYEGGVVVEVLEDLLSRHAGDEGAGIVL